MKFYIKDFALNNALGSDKKVILNKVLNSNAAYNTRDFQLTDGKFTPVFYVQENLPQIPFSFDCHVSRNNQLILLALEKMRESIEQVISDYGPKRVGVVFGTSTSGIHEGIQALKNNVEILPEKYLYSIQEMTSPSDFIKAYLKLDGIAYTISTACTSGARTFIEASYLLRSNVCDAVIVGASDSINELTVNGFHSLEAISLENTIPFSRNRQGINIGEGAAVFILTRDEGSFELLAAGQSSDGYHASAPHPEGKGAILAMQMALDQALLKASQVDYINLHGTGTTQNDQVESLAMSKIFPDFDYVASSTKPFLGHCLGAAGAQEAGLCLLVLSELNIKGSVPPHVWDNEVDSSLEKVELASQGQVIFPKVCMSNSYAFGGNNVSLIFGKNL